MTNTTSLDALTDQALLGQFGELVRQDHEGNAQLLRHIDAIDRRQIWAKQGHSSMFDWLVVRHHMSESTAGKRIGAARTARRFPILFSMVARGEIHLSGIHRLKAHLTPENHEHVLAAAKHNTIRQIEALVARIAPQPDVPSTLRALPRQPEAASAMSLQLSPAPAPAPAGRPLPKRAPDPAPLSPGRYKLVVTLGETAKGKLDQLQDLLAHQIPNSDPAAIIERALDALLTEVHKQKIGIMEKPRAPKAKHKSTTTTRRKRVRPAAGVRREVWRRDEGRCAFVGEDGHRCNATRGLEYAHIHPWAKGGDDTATNLSLRCPAHNAFEADCDYGASFIASKRQRRRGERPLKVSEPIARYVVRQVQRVGSGARRTGWGGTGPEFGAEVLPPTADRAEGARLGASLASRV